ncbi:MAG: hypothetical protein GYB33_15075 [Gammaproteobacteria bacterium]|uniref:TPM domain-containing protein n=1 Tax=Pseudomaricurvus alcaniphilus TaxID=1166482 RepID=UPI00140D16FD|nr:TPM domain-containing protein [Pseudomaricurvus alcaniphilus]MBR9911666.1 hypothetical protein [Gammaproteobacteria bacterium]NHN39389.1 hypothetical protein [Pseudomaricurvus alcaniphilus]
MGLLNDVQMKVVSDAIARVEAGTDAELVAVLAKSSDNYFYVSTLLAAVLALLLPLVLKFTPFWLSGDELLLAQWLLFIVAALVLRFPPLMMRLVPGRVKRQRASNFAHRQFLENNLHHTRGETGVLIFVSEAEHYVELIADRGISRHVSNEQWGAIVDQFTTRLRAGNTEQGFVECIEQCGALLQKFSPATEEKNELPNHLVVLP